MGGDSCGFRKEVSHHTKMCKNNNVNNCFCNSYKDTNIGNTNLLLRKFA